MYTFFYERFGQLKTELVSITTDAEKQIVYIARVSSTQRNDETDAKLIRYLITKRHWSPFEMAHATVRIETSRAIAQQILRHGKGFDFQEFSQRYADVTDMEPLQLRWQAQKNRQSSLEPITDPVILEIAQEAIEQAEAAYIRLINRGVARECARMVLPLTTQTTIYVTGPIRSWIHYLDSRCTPETQLEHREIALAIRAMLAKELPTIAEVLEW